VDRPADTAQTLSRGLDVLELLAAAKEGLTPTQISAELGLSRTIVYRLVSTLMDHGLARRAGDGTVTVGLAVLRLTENLLPSMREIARPVLERLAEDVGATAHFSVSDGGESLALSVVEPSTTTMHLAYRQGSRLPLGQGAVGRALLAAQEGQQGVFETHSEVIEGASGIAAAVPGLPGLAGAVGVVTFTVLRRDEIGPRVQLAADELGALLTAAR
jgi:DNA-binding IclR family transcriptional regulator